MTIITNFWFYATQNKCNNDVVLEKTFFFTIFGRKKNRDSYYIVSIKSNICQKVKVCCDLKKIGLSLSKSDFLLIRMTSMYNKYRNRSNITLAICSNTTKYFQYILSNLPNKPTLT